MSVSVLRLLLDMKSSLFVLRWHCKAVASFLVLRYWLMYELLLAVASGVVGCLCYR